eukprot:scaffold1537_cov162-Ochromonas_danica.AAC.13
MSIWQQLNQDILHYLFTEWLEWKDLSAMDIAYLKKKDRKTFWLSSLTHLTIPTSQYRQSLSGVTVWLNDLYIEPLARCLSEIILQVLIETVRENSLVKIDLNGAYRYHGSPVLIAHFLSKLAFV